MPETYSTKHINQYPFTQEQKDLFATLYAQYSGRIFHFAMGYLKSEAEAEELVQDVFIRLWEKKESLLPEKNLRAYLYKITVNCIYDLIRKKNVQQAFFDFLSEKNYAGEDTWNEVVFNDMLRQIDELMKEMPLQQRRIFVLSKLEGFSNDEIAGKLNLSKRTVENQLYRAVAFLKVRIHSESITLILFYSLFC